MMEKVQEANGCDEISGLEAITSFDLDLSVDVIDQETCPPVRVFLSFEIIG
jgi:hypothetical protein